MRRKDSIKSSIIHKRIKLSERTRTISLQLQNRQHERIQQANDDWREIRQCTLPDHNLLNISPF
jgi:hypothetical protein